MSAEMVVAVRPSRVLQAVEDEQSLITLLALVEGDILIYLEESRGRVTLRRLIQALDWPSRMVVMGVGALVRRKLVIGSQQPLEVLLELAPESRAARASAGPLYGERR